MKIIKATDKKAAESFLAKLEKRARGGNEAVVRTVSGILEDVRRRGDRALKKYTLRFDGHEKTTLSAAEIEKIAAKAEPSLVKALKFSANRVRAFHKRQVQRSWFFEERGIKLGQIIRPLERVGVYVPGGKASYPSSVLMNVIPAQVAGVREVALVVPAPGLAFNPAVMAAVRMLGVKEVYPVGGAQAVAALAYGTESIRRVDKITGPGNIYVATAKRLVFGEVDIDMIAGPSEILVIADSSAPPSFVAADLLSQAEHDELASAILVTDSAELAAQVQKELKMQLGRLSRSGIAKVSLARFGAVFLVEDMKEAAGIANTIAPEHLEVMTKNPEDLLKEIRNAGAVFLGRWSPEPLGDYAAGPNHTLPTGGTARFSSPLGVYDFLKHTSYLRFSREGFERIASQVEEVAGAEGLSAHKNAVSIRRKGF
ncbi:MAG: histidinol dehydrogenase [Nitrospiraceae bacterium]|nr:histidinol dehydrogenase [Nitrospiraceae bacterium]